jgi:hypothetical protein
MPPLAAWDNFYVIIGSSAAALTGLQFVVAALMADRIRPTSAHATDTFATPTVVHFCAVLLVSAILSAPWSTLHQVAVALGACGVAGVIYAVIVLTRTRRTTEYQMVMEDWICHVVLPFAGYAAILAAAVMLERHGQRSLFVVAAALLLLMLNAIHNAWDTATYVAFVVPKNDPAGQPPPPPSA